MTINRRLMAGTACVALASVLGSGTGVAQRGDTPPEARYVMDAGTVAGFMGQGDSHELTLRLGSRLAATGAPKADHFMPPAARLGASVPLVTPVRSTGDAMPAQFQRPKGRLLVYWGCGAHAGPGQPIVIDFAKVAKGQFPPNLFSTRVPVETGPMQGNSRTYGDWPNASGGRSLSPQSSLLGQHRIAGSYSPEISFALNQDFMDGLRVRSSANADGSTAMRWAPLANATGYYAWVMGGKNMGEDGGDLVWWASSSTQEFGGGLWNWLSPGTVNRLIGQKVVMPPSQTSCIVPAEVKQAGGDMLMSFVYAYGPEANFAFPARPADPKLPWHPKWTAQVRYRSMAQVMLGMPDMPQMGGMRMDGGDEAESEAPRRQQKKKPCKPGLGGLLGGALTGNSPC